MFTAEQLHTAHSKVKSGADFPAYTQEIKVLGVTHYQAYVADGHIDYHRANQHIAKVPAKCPEMAISDIVNREEFKSKLKTHQQGKTNFLTFIQMCARVGIEK